MNITPWIRVICGARMGYGKECGAIPLAPGGFRSRWSGMSFSTRIQIKCAILQYESTQSSFFSKYKAIAADKGLHCDSSGILGSLPKMLSIIYNYTSLRSGLSTLVCGIHNRQNIPMPSYKQALGETSWKSSANHFNFFNFLQS